jgi:hypothetical protein
VETKSSGTLVASKRDPDGLTPRFLANVTEREARVISARILACVVAAGFATLFLEDVSTLRSANWPKGWPTLLTPLTMARLLLVGGTGLGLLLSLVYMTRRRGSWLLLPGVGLFRSALSQAPRAFRPSELELARTSNEAFWVVRRGEPTWLRPMIVPFKGEAQRELFERWLSERPYDYTDMLGPFSLLEPGQLTESDQEALGPFALMESGEAVGDAVEPPPESGEAEKGLDPPLEAEGAPHEPEEPKDLEVRVLQPETRARWGWSLGVVVTIFAALVVLAEVRYGGGLTRDQASLSGSAAFVSDVWKLAAAATGLLLLGLAGFARPGRVLLLGERLLVVGGYAFPLRAQPQVAIGGGRLHAKGRAWTIGHATESQHWAEVAWSGAAEAEETLGGLDLQFERSGGARPILRGLAAVLGICGVVALASLLVRDLPFYTLLESRDRHHQQAFLVKRVSDGAYQGLVVSRPPIDRPGAGATFSLQLAARHPSWSELFAGGPPAFTLSSLWPTERDRRLELLLPEGGVVLTRGTERVVEGRVELDAKLEEELEEGWRGVPGLLEGRLSPESPAELRDFAAGFSSVREFLVEDSRLSLRWVLDRGQIRWIDIAPKPQGVTGIPLARRLALRWNPPRWTEEKNLRPQARRTGTNRGYYDTKLPSALQLLKATQEIRAGDAAVQEAVEPLLPGLWPPAPPPRRGGRGSRQ